MIVVGAGAAGISAAANLIKGGLNVLLLESRDRVGGRVHSKQIKAGTFIELGANWQAIEKQHNLQELVDRFDFKRTPTYDKGKAVVWTAKGEKKKKGDGMVEMDRMYE